MDIYDEMVRLRQLGQKCALATIVQVRGSIPSYESAKLLVREDGSMIGTIGGGCVEAEVWNAAREVIETEKPRHLTFNLGQDAAYDNGLICGGQLDVFVEPVMPAAARVHLRRRPHFEEPFEGRRPGRFLPPVIIDNREAFANRERFPEADEIFAEEYEEVFPKLPVNETSYMIIVTRGHRDDMRVLRWAVTTPAPLHRHDRQQAQGDRRGQGTGKGRHSARQRSSASSRPWAWRSARSRRKRSPFRWWRR